MKSIILQTATRYLFPILLIFSFFLFVRGHNEPGGGFVGGLVAAAAYALYSIAYGVSEARNLLMVTPLTLIITGLIFAVGSGIFPLFFNELFLTGMWHEQYIPIINKVGTPLFFDIGVFFVVLGISLLIIFNLTEEVLDK